MKRSLLTYNRIEAIPITLNHTFWPRFWIQKLIIKLYTKYSFFPVKHEEKHIKPFKQIKNESLLIVTFITCYYPWLRRRQKLFKTLKRCSWNNFHAFLLSCSIQWWEGYLISRKAFTQLYSPVENNNIFDTVPHKVLRTDNFLTLFLK